MSISITSTSERQTMELAAQMAPHLHPGDLIALEGQLGAGKTCFVRGLAKGLGISPRSVTSPTFIICQQYGDDEGVGGLGMAPVTLIHIDAYRLNGPQELDTIGFSEMLESGDAIIAVEWPSRVATALPDNRFEITFEHAGESARTIAIDGPADRIAEMKEAGAFSAAVREFVCRTCGRRVDASGQHFPFCSERCRLADLGKWFSESYRTSRRVEADEELEE